VRNAFTGWLLGMLVAVTVVLGVSALVWGWDQPMPDWSLVVDFTTGMVGGALGMAWGNA